jgi:hypothetical protein
MIRPLFVLALAGLLVACNAPGDGSGLDDPTHEPLCADLIGSGGGLFSPFVSCPSLSGQGKDGGVTLTLDDGGLDAGEADDAPDAGTDDASDAGDGGP